MSYYDYIQSPEWKSRKYSFYKKNGRNCAACGSNKQTLIHHLSYEHLGKEPDGDLVVLCWDCHRELHLKFGARRWDLKEKSYQFIQEKQAIVAAEELAWII